MNGYQQWKESLPSEISFWRDLISGLFPKSEWVAEMRDRITGRQPFPGHLVRYLKAGDAVRRILDVGAGPATTVGPMAAPGQIEIIAVDPLADAYNALLGKHGFTPHNRTLHGEGESLSKLGLGLFDLVYSRNALDHSYDPVRVIREMLAVCKPDGVVFFEGSVNESLKQSGEGLHQWNFMPVDNGDLVIWHSNNRAVSLRRALGDASVKATGADWYQVEITPA